MKKDFSTYDLNLCSTLVALGYELQELDRTIPNKVRFVFKREEGLEQTIDGYWNNSVSLPAQQLLNTQKMIKNRIYSDAA